MDDQNDSAVMKKAKHPNPDSIPELLKAMDRCSKRRKLTIVGVHVKLYSDGSGYVNDQFENLTGFATIAECLDILSR